MPVFLGETGNELVVYGTKPLNGVKDAFLRGAGAGLLAGMAGGILSPYGLLRNPRRGCGSPSPFTSSLGYVSAKGYRYNTLGTGSSSACAIS